MLAVGLTIATAIVIPALIAEVRYRSRMGSRVGKLESMLEFLQTYLLKNAVLEFHNNPNPKTDKIIEKINAGEKVTEGELEQLKQKLEGIVENAPDTRKKLKAERTLELMEKIFDWQGSVSKTSRARDDLFNA